MSLSHELRVLELDSQTQVLERLRLLTEFGSNLVNVSGVAGAGKSWLAQRYLEAWVSDKDQSLLLCHPSQDDHQRRSTLLSQVVSGGTFNPQDSLSDSLTRILDGESCDLVIVVDDAHLLSESLISELWRLVQRAQQQPAWNISVVLFSQSGSLDRLLERLSDGQDIRPIDIEIESFSQNEADRFFEQLVMRYVEDDMERQVRHAYRKVTLTPGEIMALSEQKAEKRIIIRSIVGSPVRIALLVLILLLLLGGGYWWMMSQPGPGERIEQLTAGGEQTVIPTLPQDGTATSGDVSELPASGADDDSAALPPDVIDTTASVGEADSKQQRVVITSDVVDALLEGKTSSKATNKTPAVAQDTAEDGKVQDKPSADTPVRQTPDPGTTAQPPAPAASPAAVQFSFAREELMAFSPRSYTLQLAAVTSLQEVQQFIDQYQLAGKVRVYPTVRSGQDWYIVTYQNYPTIQLARDAVATLPDALQQLEPWAKSIRQVQREIERAK